MEAARAHPDRFAILGNFPSTSPRARAGRHVEAAPGDARMPLHLHRAGAEQVADGRDARLAVAGGRARGPAHRDDGSGLSPEDRRGRPAAPEPQADPRSPRSPEGGHEPGRAVGESGGRARAREISQRRDEGDRRAELLRSALPVSRHPRQPAPALRRLRPRALVLGHRHHAHALPVASVRDAVHGRAALAEGPRPRTGHGPGRL
jgi:hypothetical protein